MLRSFGILLRGIGFLGGFGDITPALAFLAQLEGPRTEQGLG